MRDLEPQFDEVDGDEVSEDGPGSGIVRMFPENMDMAANDISQSKDIIEVWCRDNPHLKASVQLLRRLGVDLNPLRIRLEDSEELDLLQVIFHMRDYVYFILNTLNLRFKHNVRSIRVHTQRSLSDAAIDFADRAAKQGNSRESQGILTELETLLVWLSNEEKNYKILMQHI